MSRNAQKLDRPGEAWSPERSRRLALDPAHALRTRVSPPATHPCIHACTSAKGDGSFPELRIPCEPALTSKLSRGTDDPPWAAFLWIGCSQTGRFHGAAGAREVKEEAHGAIVPGRIDRTGATLTRMELKDLRRDALKLADWITDRSIAGVSPLSSAADLAERYRIDAGFADDDKRVDALIRWETTKNFTAGFITGLGGVLTLPITVPGSVAASWLIQARMAAAIASIYGHDPRSDRVRTVVLLALVGDASASKLLKGAGIALGRQAALRAIERVGGRTLTELNREVGTQLIAKGTVKGARGVGKLVPIAGGVVSGAFDAVSCQVVGRCAKRMFRPG